MKINQKLTLETLVQSAAVECAQEKDFRNSGDLKKALTMVLVEVNGDIWNEIAAQVINAIGLVPKETFPELFATRYKETKDEYFKENASWLTTRIKNKMQFWTAHRPELRQEYKDYKRVTEGLK